MRAIASLIGLVAALGACESDAKRSERTAQASTANTLEDRAEGGIHRRVTTAHGPLHLWTPRHYSETGDIVVYVHGNYTHVDDAWQDHRLAKQFAASGLDALFIACEAPAGPDEDVSWASLSELLGTTHRAVPLPSGRVIVVGHSAAHRTVVPWLAESQLDGVVMLDAVYGDVGRYRSWLRERRDRQLIFVGDDTREYTDELHALLPEAKVHEYVPALGQASGGRVVYVKSKLGHMEMLTSGLVLPIVLQMAGDVGGVPVAQLP